MEVGDIRTTKALRFDIEIMDISDGVVCYKACNPNDAGFIYGHSILSLIERTTSSASA